MFVRTLCVVRQKLLLCLRENDLENVTPWGCTMLYRKQICRLIRVRNHKDKHRGLLSLEIMRVFYKDDHKRIKQRPFGIPFMMLRCSQFKEIMMPLTCAPPEVQRSMGGETWWLASARPLDEREAMAAAETSHERAIRLTPERVAMMQFIMRAPFEPVFSMCVPAYRAGSLFWDCREVMTGMCPSYTSCPRISDIIFRCNLSCTIYGVQRFFR
jgi:hypothetical protein